MLERRAWRTILRFRKNCSELVPSRAARGVWPHLTTKTLTVKSNFLRSELYFHISCRIIIKCVFLVFLLFHHDRKKMHLTYLIHNVIYSLRILNMPILV